MFTLAVAFSVIQADRAEFEHVMTEVILLGLQSLEASVTLARLSQRL